MKKNILLTIAALACAFMWTACEREEDFILEEEEPEQAVEDVNVLTLTLKAVKDVDTKALSLDDSNPNGGIIAYWKDTDKVKVFKGDQCIGTLDVTPGQGDKPTNATLSGQLPDDDINTGDVLTLLIPRETVDYSGQTGALTGENSVETMFDYATATITVQDKTAISITTTDAAFTNLQNVYRISFKANNAPLSIKSFSIVSKRYWNNTLNTYGKIVGTRTFDGTEWTKKYAPFELNLPNGTASSEPLYAAFSDENSDYDGVRYTFSVIGEDNILYMGNKEMKSHTPHGHFISARNIHVEKVLLTTSDETASYGW